MGPEPSRGMRQSVRYAQFLWSDRYKTTAGGCDLLSDPTQIQPCGPGCRQVSTKPFIPPHPAPITGRQLSRRTLVNEHRASIPACTEMERYLFDLNGYLILRNALSPRRWLPATPPMTSSRRRPSWYAKAIHFIGTDDPENFDGHHGPAFIDECFGTIRGPGGAQRLHSGGHVGTIRTRFRYHAGRFHCGQINVLMAFTDIGPGDGATMVIPGSHKSNIRHPQRPLLPRRRAAAAAVRQPGIADLFDGVQRLTLAEHLAEDPVVPVELGLRRRIRAPRAVTLVHRGSGLAQRPEKARCGGGDHRPAEQGGVG